MAGGIGSRFWPMSRESRPKQFLDMLDTGQSLIRMTFDRFAHFVPMENIYIVTNANYVEQIAEHIPHMDRSRILAEPLRRNTAPCVAYVAYKIKQLDPEANLIVAPADHLIRDTEAFERTVEQAVEFAAQSDSLITLGIRPDWPNTGYGYIQYLESKNGTLANKVKTFTEKPNRELAEQFILSGDFLWNSGIFIWSVGSITSAFEQHLPDVGGLFAEIDAHYNTPAEADHIGRAYSQCKNISIDYGIMEKAENTYVIPADFGWCDLGTWQSLWEQSDRDARQNAVLGEKILTYEAKNNVVVAPDKKLVILDGLEDYIVVDTVDALLICRKENEQAVKAMNRDVQERFGREFA